MGVYINGERVLGSSSRGGGGGGGAVPPGSANDLVILDGAGAFSKVTPGASSADARLVLGLAASDPGMPPAGLAAAWLASSLTGVADGAKVTSWAPSTGVGTLTSAGSSSSPTMRATGSPTGGRAVEFPGGSDGVYLNLFNPAGLPSGAGAGTIVAIVCRARVVGGAGLQHVVHYGTADGSRARGMAITGGGLLRTHEWSAGVPGTPFPAGWGTRVFGHSYDGSTLTLLVDGVDIGSTDIVLNTGADELAFGSRISGAPAETGAFLLLGVFFYSRALTSDDWARVATHARIAHGAQGLRG